MAPAPYLIFCLHRTLYAVPATAVQKIIWLPELTALPESPPYIAGVVNLRGRLVPVIDLCERMKHRKQPYRVEDSVIVLECEGRLFGIIVNDVHQVRSVVASEIEASPTDIAGNDDQPGARFLSGVAKIDEDIVMLLDVHHLLHLTAEIPTEALDVDRIESITPERDDLFCPEAKPAVRAKFRARASKLRQPLLSRCGRDLVPLAVVGLSGEYFGIDLSVVRRFSILRAITPVPCCPRHVVGQVNLRGDVLTVVDIRAALQMPQEPATNNTSIPTDSKVVVVQSGALQVGVLVDEVLDVVNLQPTQISPVPAATRSRGEEYLKGMAPCGENMMAILDLPKILHHGSLVVNQDV